jgi:hypothetical protein
MPTIGEPLTPPKPVVPTHKDILATKATSQSIFEKALLGQVEGLSLEDTPETANGFGLEAGADEGGSAKKGANLIEVDDEEDAAGWDMGGVSERMVTNREQGAQRRLTRWIQIGLGESPSSCTIVTTEIPRGGREPGRGWRPGFLRFRRRG